MTKQVKEALKKIPYYGSITRKYRFSNPVKDKAWSILSDFVRCRDTIKFGTCVSSGKPIRNWRECDAGHYYSMGGHGALSGFDEMNVHAQSKNDNQLGSMHTGNGYGKTLEKRYGTDLLEYLREISNKTIKADDWFFIERIKEIHGFFTELKKEHPDFDYPQYMQ